MQSHALSIRLWKNQGQGTGQKSQNDIVCVCGTTCLLFLISSYTIAPLCHALLSAIRQTAAVKNDSPLCALLSMWYPVNQEMLTLPGRR